MRLTSIVTLGLSGVSGLLAGGATHAVVNPVPEPGTLILLAAGAGAVLLLTKRGRGK